MNPVPHFQPAPHIRVMINIGACLDISTGTYIKGRRGEHILNGGLPLITGITGIGNNFKSTVERFMMLTAMSRMPPIKDSPLIEQAITCDTESNIHEWHQRNVIERIAAFHGEDVLDSGRWVISDKTVYTGNVFWEKCKEWMAIKMKIPAKKMVELPFFNRERTGPFLIPYPTFCEIDSFTYFETEDVIKMQNENELGESGANTIHMRQGLAKMRMLMEIPRLCASSYTYMLMSAHLGKESAMQSAGGGREVPVTTLKYLKNGDAIKGVTKLFTFATSICWHAYNASPMINQGTKGPEYPRDRDDNLNLDTDLNTVQIRVLRSKSGTSGMSITLIVSQSEGVLPSLTEFHHIKEMGRYGLEGNDRTYSLALYPSCSLSRTTVRGKIDSDEKLCRALNITSEMCQMENLWHGLPDGFMCSPKQLYDDLIAKGYDWDLLLNTRGWYTYDNDTHPIPFLSTYDLLNMRAGKYHPYWYPVKQENLSTTKIADSTTAAILNKAKTILTDYLDDIKVERLEVS